MSKIITANIPARKVIWGGKINTYQAHTKTFTQDDSGRWTLDFDGKPEPLFEAEVIDVCLKATNWREIKAAHFPMHGFYEPEPTDNTPSHK